jgi:hypothetical protein
MDIGQGGSQHWRNDTQTPSNMFLYWLKYPLVFQLASRDGCMYNVSHGLNIQTCSCQPLINISCYGRVLYP